MPRKRKLHTSYFGRGTVDIVGNSRKKVASLAKKAAGVSRYVGIHMTSIKRFRVKG